MGADVADKREVAGGDLQSRERRDGLLARPLVSDISWREGHPGEDVHRLGAGTLPQSTSTARGPMKRSRCGALYCKADA